MQELFNKDGDELGEIFELGIENFKHFFQAVPGRQLFIQAAGIWLEKPVLFPVDIAQAYSSFVLRRVTRVQVAEMIKWEPGKYFLYSVNFS